MKDNSVGAGDDAKGLLKAALLRLLKAGQELNGPVLRSLNGRFFFFSSSFLFHLFSGRMLLNL